MSSERAEQTVSLVNRHGLYIGAAAKFIQLANQFPCEIRVEKGGQAVNGKSIMGLLMLVASKGATITISAAGERAEDAVAALAALVNDKFDEPA